IVVGLTVGVNRYGALLSSSWWSPTANGWSPQQARPGFGVVGGFALVLLLGLAMVGPLFAQTGWANVTFTAGEVRNPGRNLPRAGTLNGRHVPAAALVTQGFWASLLTLPRTVTTGSAGVVYGNVYTQFLEYIISAELVFYALMVGAVIVLRRTRPAADRPYRT